MCRRKNTWKSGLLPPFSGLAAVDVASSAGAVGSSIASGCWRVPGAGTHKGTGGALGSKAEKTASESKEFS